MLKDGEPCGHAGCLNHISHPCEGCGRIGGVVAEHDESEDMGYVPDCFGTGDYACGSEECDFCPFEEDCK